VRCVSSGATRTSYAQDLHASQDPIPDARGEDTKFCPTRTQRRERRRPRRAVLSRTIDPAHTTTR
jgi:hypothetical protein